MIRAKAILCGVAVSAVAALGWMGATMINDGSETRAPDEHAPRQISVRLLGASEEITGMDVPKGLANQGDTYLRVEHPADVVVDLPGARRVQTRVKYVSINVSHGVVVDVHLITLPEPVPFRDAVTELRRLLSKIGLEPDEEMRAQIAQWPQDSGAATYSAGMWLSDEVGLATELRHSDAGGWFFVTTFAVRASARRVLWDPTLRPASTAPTERP